MKNFEIEKFRKILISKNFKIFIEKCMKMKNFEIENFRKFSISKFFDLASLDGRRSSPNKSFSFGSKAFDAEMSPLSISKEISDSIAIAAE